MGHYAAEMELNEPKKPPDVLRYKQLGDGSVWPRTGDPAPGDEGSDSLEWVLRYAPERLTRGDQLHLASIVEAYRELLSCTDRRRREVIRGMRPSQGKGKPE